jgi:hypothetical protein
MNDMKCKENTIPKWAWNPAAFRYEYAEKEERSDGVYFLGFFEMHVVEGSSRLPIIKRRMNHE